MKLKSSYLPCLAILCLSFLLTGCADLAPVGEFAKGAQALSEASGKFYETTLDTDRALTANLVKLDKNASNQDSTPCPKNTSAFYCQVNDDNLLQETRRNRAAIQALHLYAQSLKAIAEFNDDANIEKASQELSGNLQGLSDSLQGLAKGVADPKDSVLANAISALGKVYIDLKIQEEVFKKTKEAQPSVEIIVNTFKDDIDRQLQRMDILRADSQSTRKKLFEDLSTAYQNKKATPLQKTQYKQQAGNLVSEQIREDIAYLPNKTILASLKKTADGCLKAHEAIQNPDLKTRGQTIGEFVKDAKGLLSGVKALTP